MVTLFLSEWQPPRQQHDKTTHADVGHEKACLFLPCHSFSVGLKHPQHTHTHTRMEMNFLQGQNQTLHYSLTYSKHTQSAKIWLVSKISLISQWSNAAKVANMTMEAYVHQLAWANCMRTLSTHITTHFLSSSWSRIQSFIQDFCLRC